MAVACLWQHVHVTTTTLSWDVVTVDKPDDVNVVIGQAHFIKTVEDLHEAMVGVSSSLRFGLAFCEASGPRLVRRTGNDPELVELVTRNALAMAVPFHTNAKRDPRQGQRAEDRFGGLAIRAR